MISGTLFFTLIVDTIAALQSFTEATRCTSATPATATYSNDAALFYAIYLFQQAFQFLHMGYASALAWLLFLIIMVITAVQVRLSRRVRLLRGRQDGRRRRGSRGARRPPSVTAEPTRGPRAGRTAGRRRLQGRGVLAVCLGARVRSVPVRVAGERVVQAPLARSSTTA
jgi:hypothetical protein